MVEHCVNEQMPMAICHVAKTLRQGPKEQSVDQALQSNQSTYVPVSVVSAGECKLIKTLDDGRLMINVFSEKRYQLTEQVQSLPFYIYHAEEELDEEMSAQDLEQAIQLKEKLLHRLVALTADNQQLQALLTSNSWTAKPVARFSFEIFSILHTSPELMQRILEQPSALERMKVALILLSEVPAQL